jgi:hypothetical protein
LSGLSPTSVGLYMGPRVTLLPPENKRGSGMFFDAIRCPVVPSVRPIADVRSTRRGCFAPTSRYIHADRDYFTIESGFYLSSVHFSSRNPLIYHAARTPSRTTAFRFIRYLIVPSLIWRQIHQCLPRLRRVLASLTLPFVPCLTVGSREDLQVGDYGRPIEVSCNTAMMGATR